MSGEADAPQILEALASRFIRFAREQCHNYSPLYEKLAMGISRDRDILALAAMCRKEQPVPNLFLGSVHFLLQNGARDPLSTFYPNLGGEPPPDEDPYPAFRAFVLQHREDIFTLISTRLVQTNEVRRSACLFPAFGVIAGRAGGKPLSLIEVGASAGLNLLWDRSQPPGCPGPRFREVAEGSDLAGA